MELLDFFPKLPTNGDATRNAVLQRAQCQLSLEKGKDKLEQKEVRGAHIYIDNQNKWTKLELFGYVSLETEIVED